MFDASAINFLPALGISREEAKEQLLSCKENLDKSDQEIKSEKIIKDTTEGLKLSWELKDYGMLSYFFERIADQEAQQSKVDFIKISILYNASLKAQKKFDDTSLESKTIKEKLRKNEKEFLLSISATVKDLKGQPNREEKFEKEFKSGLDKIIADSEDLLKQLSVQPSSPINFNRRSAEIFDIYEKIDISLRSWLNTLFVDCQRVLEKLKLTPHGKFCLIALGSLAKKAATPFSDFEFAVLVEKGKDTPENIRYFESLSTLLALRIVNLGKTSIPESWYGVNFDDLMEPGFQFDLGGKTPLGRVDKPYRLIKSPERMVEEYVAGAGFDIDKFLPIELSSSDFLYGEETLFADYQKRIKNFFNTKVEGHFQYKRRALSVMVGGIGELEVGDIAKYEPNFIGDAIEGKPYQVKQEIYRFPDRLIDGFALYFGIHTGPLKNKLEKLFGSKRISKIAFNNLMKMSAIAYEIRLRLCLKNKSQKDILNIITPLQEFIPLSNISDENTNFLFNFYYIAIPFYNAVRNMLYSSSNEEVQLAEDFFKKSETSLFDNSFVVKVDVYSRLMQYEKAIQVFRPMVEGKYNKFLLKTERLGLIFADDLQVYDLIRDINFLSCLYVSLKNFDEQKSWLKKIYTITDSIIYKNLYVKKVAEAKKDIYVQSVKTMLLKQEANCAHNQGISFMINLNNFDFKNALKFFEIARKKYIEIYPNKDHFAYAEVLINLGSLYLLCHTFEFERNKLWKTPLGVKRLKELLNEAENYFSEGSRLISKDSSTKIARAKSQFNLGVVYMLQERYEEAERNQIDSLRVFITQLGNNHPLVVSNYRSLAQMYNRMKRYDLANQYYKMATDSQIKPVVDDIIEKAGILVEHAGSLIDEGGATNIQLAICKLEEFDKIEYESQGSSFYNAILRNMYHTALMCAHIRLANYYLLIEKNEENAEYYYTKIQEKCATLDLNLQSLQEIFEFLIAGAEEYKKLEEAEEYRRAYSTIYHNLIKNKNNYGKRNYRQGKYKESINIFHNLLELLDLSQEKDFSLIADTYYNLGSAYKSALKYQEACQWLQKSELLRANLSGEKNEKAIKAKIKYNEASKLLQESKAFPTEQKETIVSRGIVTIVSSIDSETNAANQSYPAGFQTNKATSTASFPHCSSTTSYSLLTASAPSLSTHAADEKECLFVTQKPSGINRELDDVGLVAMSQQTSGTSFTTIGANSSTLFPDPANGGIESVNLSVANNNPQEKRKVINA